MELKKRHHFVCLFGTIQKLKTPRENAQKDEPEYGVFFVLRFVWGHFGLWKDVILNIFNMESFQVTQSGFPHQFKSVLEQPGRGWHGFPAPPTSFNTRVSYFNQPLHGKLHMFRKMLDLLWGPVRQHETTYSQGVYWGPCINVTFTGMGGSFERYFSTIIPDFFTFIRLLVASRAKESGVEGVRFLRQLTSIQPRHQTPEVWLAVSISCRAA